MDLGSGLTFGTRTVNGKVTTGIFFGNKSKKVAQKLPIRSTVHPDDVGTLKKTQTIDQTEKITRKPKPMKSATNDAVVKPRQPKSRKAEKIPPKNNDDDDNKPEVNTKYVTLTQSQLSTILGLVKSSNDLDISAVLSDTNSDKESDRNESENVDGAKDKSFKKDDKKESIANLLDKKKSDPKVDDNSENGNNGDEPTTENNKSDESSKENEKNDGSSKKDEKTDEPSDNTKKSDSSFFFGNSRTRNGASSANKREEQRRWRVELEQQRDEQRQRKANERTARLQQEDEELWTKHFDTMLPATKASPRVTMSSNDFTKTSQDKEPTVSKSEMIPTDLGHLKSGSNLTKSVDNSELGDFVSTLTSGPPQRSSYLRTMTSLLDPAQIEALELKRKKQEEHRKAIALQVEERKQKKEREEERRRELEAEEDRRLAQEREFFTRRAENEKARQQLQESEREKQTRELYQQMKSAEESALRDKLARREQLLRTKGHDTSRLERTHQIALEMSQKAEAIPDVSTSAAHSPRDERSDYAVMHTEQGPIRLEIKLNQKHNGALVESGVQTDGVLSPDFSFQRMGSDEETEYLKLPQKSKNTRNRAGNQNVADSKRVNESRPKWGACDKKKSTRRYNSEQQRHETALRRREEREREKEEEARKRAESRHRQEIAFRKRREQEIAVKRQEREDSLRRRRDKPASEPPKARQKGGSKPRPSSGIHATSDNAKYRSDRHTNASPVPRTNDFVEYRRTMAVLDPSLPQSRPGTGPQSSELAHPHKSGTGAAERLLHPGIFPKHERQDQILREISILRQGLLLKQREVAAYPAAMTHNIQPLGGASSPTSLILAAGGNLPERTNDTP